MAFPHPINSYEETVIRNVREYGWHFTHVLGDDDDPSFSYSVGLVASYGYPEIILCGLPQGAAHGLIGLIASRAAGGKPIDPSTPSTVIIQDCPCVFVEVTRKNREEYARSTCWLYGSSDFPMYQLVWASKQGVFPWHSDASERFRWSQPVLGDVGGDESEPLLVDCGAHGKRVAAVVCGHMLGPPPEHLGFVENSSDPNDLQGWCLACEETFTLEGSMTEAFLAFNQAAVVCVKCYAELKAWHQSGVP